MKDNEKCVILSKKEYGDERLSILDEALNIINVFENLPWWKRIFYKPNYFKQ